MEKNITPTNGLHIDRTLVKCLKCGYIWSPRTPIVLQCQNPKCRRAGFLILVNK
jgi:hypothetical protein